MRELKNAERTCILQEIGEEFEYQMYQDVVGSAVVWTFSDKEEFHMAVVACVDYKEKKITLKGRRETVIAEFGRVKIYAVAN